MNSRSKTSSKRKESKNSSHSDSTIGNEKNKNKKKSAPKVVQRRDGKSKVKNFVDIFNEHAIINAYYTCHNVQDLLKIRGFPWPELTKKKKKKSKK